MGGARVESVVVGDMIVHTSIGDYKLGEQSGSNRDVSGIGVFHQGFVDIKQAIVIDSGWQVA